MKHTIDKLTESYFVLRFVFPHCFLSQVYNTSQSSRALGWDTNNYIADHYRYVVQVLLDAALIERVLHTVYTWLMYLYLNAVVVETSHR